MSLRLLRASPSGGEAGATAVATTGSKTLRSRFAPAHIRIIRDHPREDAENKDNSNTAGKLDTAVPRMAPAILTPHTSSPRARSAQTVPMLRNQSSRRNSLSRYNPIGREGESVSQSVTSDTNAPRPASQSSWRHRRPQSLTAPFSSNAINATTVTATATATASTAASAITASASPATQTTHATPSSQRTPMTHNSLLSPLSSASNASTSAVTNPSATVSPSPLSSSQAAYSRTTLISVLSPSLLSVLTHISEPTHETENADKQQLPSQLQQPQQQRTQRSMKSQRRPKQVDTRVARKSPPTPLDPIIDTQMVAKKKKAKRFLPRKHSVQTAVLAPLTSADNNTASQGDEKIEGASSEESTTVSSESASALLTPVQPASMSLPHTRVSSLSQSSSVSLTTNSSHSQSPASQPQQSTVSIEDYLSRPQRRGLSMRVRHSSMGGAILVDQDLMGDEHRVTSETFHRPHHHHHSHTHSNTINYHGHATNAQEFTALSALHNHVVNAEDPAPATLTMLLSCINNTRVDTKQRQL